MENKSVRVQRLEFYKSIRQRKKLQKPRIKRSFNSNNPLMELPPREIPLFDPSIYYDTYAPTYDHDRYNKALVFVSGLFFAQGLSVKPALSLARSIVQNNFPPIRTISDLVHVADNELTSIRNIGPKHFEEIRRVFPYSP
ncbi:hypothetical protein HYS91_03695 [Candidatus Daviesbacteria bacterium]|nr:hypothetical protein [Candidatus Daviesbacteria bacterium]